MDLLLWPHDSNLTMTVLYNVLTDYTRSHNLPENLYLQMDNTSRENKNKYVLGFCAILVQLKNFKKVCTLFLPLKLKVQLFAYTFN